MATRHNSSLKIMANSGQIVNLVQEKNMRKIVNFYSNQDMIIETRVAIAETFVIIAKNIGLRKLFFQRELLN